MDELSTEPLTVVVSRRVKKGAEAARTELLEQIESVLVQPSEREVTSGTAAWTGLVNRSVRCVGADIRIAQIIGHNKEKVGFCGMPSSAS